MNRLKLAALTLGLVFFTACSSYTVKTDYDPTITYSSYRTFDWYAASKKAKGKGSGTDPLLDKRVRVAVQAELESKGFTQETAHGAEQSRGRPGTDPQGRARHAREFPADS